MYLALVQPFISRNAEWTTASATFADILRQIKVLISPITPPNYELEMAASLYMGSIGMKVPKSCIRHRAPQEAEAPKKPAQTNEKGRSPHKGHRRKNHRYYLISVTEHGNGLAKNCEGGRNNRGKRSNTSTSLDRTFGKSVIGSA